MKKTQPEAFTLDRIATPVGEVLLVTDADGAVRAFDFTDYEARMMTLLARHYGEVQLTPGRAPEAVRNAVAAYFDGDLTALDGLAVKTGGTAFQRAVWAALRTIPAGRTWSYGQLAQAIGKPAAVRAVGLANGFVLAPLIGLAAGFWFQDWRIGGVIATAMILNLLVAASVGVLTPLTLAKLKFDPAVSSAVFVTATTDFFGFLIFLGLATIVLL